MLISFEQWIEIYGSQLKNDQKFSLQAKETPTNHTLELWLGKAMGKDKFISFTRNKSLAWKWSNTDKPKKALQL